MNLLSLAMNGIFIGEIICLILAVIIFGFMTITRPRPTRSFYLGYVGIISSIITILLQLFISLIALIAGQEHEWVTRCCIMIFYLSFCVTSNCIFAYIFSLSYVNKYKFFLRDIVLAIFDFAYFLCTIIVVLDPNCIQIKGYSVEFPLIGYFYLMFGIVDVVLCIITCCTARKTIPRLIFQFITFFAVIDSFVLILQLIYRDIIFSGMTYVFPFVIFYMLFHSNPIDEFSGCRNEYSFENEFNHRKKTSYILMNVFLPKNKESKDSFKNIFLYLLADKCRRIEKLDKSIKIFSKNNFTYNVFINDMEDSKLDNLLLRVSEIMQDNSVIKSQKIKINYRIIVTRKSEYIDSVGKYYAFIKMIDKDYFKEIAYDDIYVATNKDIEKFIQFNEILRTLRNIRDTDNIDDERVICYAQPIYDIKNDRMTSAEALMRLIVNGELINPDVFIPIAEDYGCIHTLTLAMINKVCKAIKALEKNYQFEAITVNSSTLEFDSNSFSVEVTEILDRNDVDPSRIRIELTESKMAESYRNILLNMDWLKKAGIYCYLDDYGTGYSNLERIFNLPFMTIKFDKSVLYASLEDENMDDVMRGMIKSFKKKGFKILVEGVENEMMKDWCVERGFDYIQGYYYSKPVPIEDLSNFFEAK